MTTRFVILGDVPSKKNQQQIIRSKGRFLIIPSNRHKLWHKQAMSQLLGNKPVARQIEGNIESISLTFFSETLRKSDLTNRAESIMDLLVDAGIIEDDNWHVIPKLTLFYGGKDKDYPRCEINIYVDTGKETSLSSKLSN